MCKHTHTHSHTQIEGTNKLCNINISNGNSLIDLQTTCTMATIQSKAPHAIKGTARNHTIKGTARNHTDQRHRTRFTKQLLHTTVLDIKIYYYPRNAIFPEAEGRVEYCIPRVVINQRAIIVLLV